jgi:5-methylcytosine-specific restriction endonuclease McrA
MKHCNNCNELKPLDAYYKRKGGDGRHRQCKECQKQYSRDNKVRKALRARERYDPEKRAEQWQKQATPETRAKRNEYNREYKRNNKDVINKNRQDYRGRKRDAAGSFTAEQWQDRLAYYGGKCIYCGTTDNITIEHRIPLVRGGSNWASNLAPACRSCNCSKGKKTEKEFRIHLTSAEYGV